MDMMEVVSMCESAASDVAYSAVDYYPDDYEDYINQKRKEGCDDTLIKECLTDRIYDDPDFLCDMIGDMLHGEPNRDAILDELMAFGNNYRKAVEMLRS